MLSVLMANCLFFRCQQCGTPHPATMELCPFHGRASRPHVRAAPLVGPAAGTIVAGRYRVEGRLRGATQTYAATDLRRGEDVILRVFAEGRLPRRHEVDHVHVVRVIESRLSPMSFQVLERLHGETLGVRLRREGALAVEEALAIAAQVADGLAAIHAEGLLHGHVSADRIYLHGSGSDVLVKILGLGEDVEDAVSDPHHLAPEQVAGSGTAVASDVWATGVLLYRMLTGRPPFIGSVLDLVLRVGFEDVPSPGAFRVGLPGELEALILRALRRDAQHRYPTAEALGDAIDEMRRPRSCEIRLPGSPDVPGYQDVG